MGISRLFGVSGNGVKSDIREEYHPCSSKHAERLAANVSALSLSPEILCLDEFSIAIDPVTTMRIEEVLKELKRTMTIVLVTNLVQQARRLADRTAFFSDSRLIEVDETETIFTKAKNRLTERYVTGDFG